tara:strand:+ start:404 stop:724 length:321 start_codon:yes stop_codon:yes gene_type:complete
MASDLCAVYVYFLQILYFYYDYKELTVKFCHTKKEIVLSNAMSKEDVKNLSECVSYVIALLDKSLFIGENSGGLEISKSFLKRLKRDLEDGLVSIEDRDEKDVKKA